MSLIKDERGIPHLLEIVLMSVLFGESFIISNLVMSAESVRIYDPYYCNGAVVRHICAPIRRSCNLLTMRR